MAIFIGHRTALAYWRTHDRNWAQPISRAAPQENNSPYYAQMDTGILWKFGIDKKPVSILVSCKANMRKSQNLSPRIWSGKHPSRSFYKIAQDLYISTPEATFLQFGKELSLIQLITVGYELCGSYGLSVQSSSGFLRREPRSNPPAHRTLSREMRRNSRGQGGETSIELPCKRIRLSNGKLAFDASLSSSFVGRIWLAPPGA